MANSNDYTQTLGIVVKADGTLELTNGMKVMQVSTEGAADALDKLDSGIQQSNRSGKALNATLRPTAVAARELSQATSTAATSVTGLGTATGTASAKIVTWTQHTQQASTAQRMLGTLSDDTRRKLGDLGGKSDEAAGAQQRLGKSSKETAAAMRLLPAQITDVITSIASGMPLWLVAIQQGGQIKDSFGGIGATFRVLTAAINPLYAGFGALAAAGGVLALAYKQGSDEGTLLYKNIVMTGNAAGVTAGQLQDMARAASDQGGGTQGANSAAIAAMVEAGTVSRSVFQDAAAMAVELESVAGRAISTTVQELAELGNDPVAASEKLNDRYHYLTASVYEQIKALQEQGREDDAAALAQRTYTDAFAARAKDLRDNMGSIERGWLAVASAAKSGWDAILNIGRPETTGSRLSEVGTEIAALEKQINQVEKTGKLGTGLAGRVGPEWATQQKARLATLKQEQAALQESARLEQRGAEAAAARAQQEQARITWSKEADSYLTRQQKIEKEHEDRLTRINAMAKQGNIEQEEVTKRVAQEQARYKKELETANAGSNSKANQAAKADLGRDLSDIASRYKTLATEATYSERLLDAQRSAGLVSESDYYAKKRDLIQKEADLEFQSLQAQNDRLVQQKASGADAIANDRKVAENKEKMAQVQAKAQTDLTILTVQETSALAQRKAALQSFMDSQQQYLDTMQTQWWRQTASMTLSSRDQEYLTGLNSIEDKFNNARRDLDQAKNIAQIQGKWQAADEEGYQARISGLQRYQAEATRIYTQEFDKQSSLQEKWQTGAEKSINDYLESNRNTAAQTEEMFTNAFSNMEDALTTFISTGKFSFSSFTQAVLADMARIQARSIASGLLGSVSSLIPGMFSGGGSDGISGLIQMNDGWGTLGTAVAHTGGIVGGDRLATRSVPIGTHAGAPRFHTGGIVGDEVPIIARRKEGVFTQQQMKALAPVDSMAGRRTSYRNVNNISIDAGADKALMMQYVEMGVRAGQADLLTRMANGEV